MPGDLGSPLIVTKVIEVYRVANRGDIAVTIAMTTIVVHNHEKVLNLCAFERSYIADAEEQIKLHERIEQSK